MFPLYIILAWFIIGIVVLTYFYYRKDLKSLRDARNRHFRGKSGDSDGQYAARRAR